jgi:hypothetical protein
MADNKPVPAGPKKGTAADYKDVWVKGVPSGSPARTNGK